MALQVGISGNYGVMLHNKKDLSEDELKQMCSKYGPIRSFKQTPKKLVFIEYKEYEEARAFLDDLQNDIHFSARVSRRKFYDEDCLESDYAGRSRSKSLPPTARYKDKKGVQFAESSDSDLDKPKGTSSPVEFTEGRNYRRGAVKVAPLPVVIPADSFTREQPDLENSFEALKIEHLRKNSSVESSINDKEQHKGTHQLRSNCNGENGQRDTYAYHRGFSRRKYIPSRGYESNDDNNSYRPHHQRIMRGREPFKGTNTNERFYYQIPNHPPEVRMIKEPYEIERQDEYIYNHMRHVKMSPLYEVLVSNLPLWFMMGDLFQLCWPLCFISHIDMVYNRLPNSPPYALIHVRSRRDASILINQLNGHIVDNKRLIFEEVTNQTDCYSMMNHYNKTNRHSRYDHKITNYPSHN